MVEDVHEDVMEVAGMARTLPGWKLLEAVVMSWLTVLSWGM